LRESCKRERERVSSGGAAKEREGSTPWLLGSSSCGERDAKERERVSSREIKLLQEEQREMVAAKRIRTNLL
jgi:hypothetical protein